MATDIRARLSSLSTEELIKALKDAEALERQMNLTGPRTDDELHAWVKMHLGIDIPRVAVCLGHVAPFTFLADLYFERTQTAIGLANRGGSKTFIVAILHLLNSKFKRKCWSATVGAVESQALRAYAHLKDLLKREGKCATEEDNPDIVSSIQRETKWRNQSHVEVLVGTVNGVNGPHPQKVHADEVDLMDPVVFQESRNMSASADGIKAQDIITSTRKGLHGLMQQLLTEVEEAKQAGVIPPYDVFTWCAFECAQPVLNCRVANPDLPEDQKCNCNVVAKGKWDNGKPRTFDTVCAGRLARSRGWIPVGDLHKTFRTTSRSVWEAQQECRKPSTEGMVLPTFERDVHCIHGFEPDPDNGQLFMGIDFGGTNPFGVNWYQMLDVDIDVLSFQQRRGEQPIKRLKEGTLVCFDEIYVAEVGNIAVAKMILQKEAEYAEKFGPRWRVAYRFADIQAKAARIDILQHPYNLRTSFWCTRDVKEHIKVLRDLVDEETFIIDIDRCPMIVEEFEAWHYPQKKLGTVDDPEMPVDDFNHCISEARYVTSNIHVLKKRGRRRGTAMPASGGQAHTTAGAAANGMRPAIPAVGPATHVTGAMR